MSSPSFLLATDSNHNLLQSLLESMNAIIEHQYISKCPTLYIPVCDIFLFKSILSEYFGAKLLFLLGINMTPQGFVSRSKLLGFKGAHLVKSVSNLVQGIQILSMLFYETRLDSKVRSARPLVSSTQLTYLSFTVLHPRKRTRRNRAPESTQEREYSRPWRLIREQKRFSRQHQKSFVEPFTSSRTQ